NSISATAVTPQSSVTGDYNFFSGVSNCGSSPNQNLVSYSDWNNLQLDYKATTAAFDGVYFDHKKVPELAAAAEITLQKEASQSQFTGVNQPINQDGTSIFKLGQTFPVKFHLVDANGADVNNAVITFR